MKDEVQARIETLEAKQLVGIRMTMSLANNQTGKLWRQFMPRRQEIMNNVTKELISMQIYQPRYFADFKPTNEFEKWATVEVSDFDKLPESMEAYLLAGGLYAVFDYKGSSTDSRIFQFIFGKWLPQSNYLLDDRPHFEVLGEKYKNADPNSEEEIWIPIKMKPAGLQKE